MNEVLALGIVLLVGVGGGFLAKRVNLPSVTGYLVGGILVGPSVLGLVPTDVLYQLESINQLALGVIALTIGAELRIGTLKRLGSNIGRVFLVEAGTTFIFILSATMILGAPFSLALILAVLGIATAPGAIMSCVREVPSRGTFCRVLLTTVALDNLMAIAAFGIAVSLLQIGPIASVGALSFIWLLLRSLLLAAVLGALTGMFLTVVSIKTQNASIILVTTLGAIMVTVGLAATTDIPALLAAMVAGSFLINASPSPQRLLRSLETVEPPILVAFLTLAGIKLDFAVLPSVGLLGLGYIIARFAGKALGSRIGAHFTDMPRSWRHNIGMALTPQAGVAIGLSIIAEQKLPFPPGTITTLILGAVVVFEIIGPVLVKRALTLTNSEPGSFKE